MDTNLWGVTGKSIKEVFCFDDMRPSLSLGFFLNHISLGLVKKRILGFELTIAIAAGVKNRGVFVLETFQ